MELLIGLDPAPKKASVIWCNGEAHRVPAHELRHELTKLIEGRDSVWLAWDAPLSFDPNVSFYERAVDRAAKAWVSKQAPEVLQPTAVAAQPFAGCSHWAISCHVLGYPFGQELRLFELSSDRPTDKGRFVFEVHPSVSLALLWRDHGCGTPLPRYKRSPKACRAIATALSFPDAAATNDDMLDAYVAFLMLDMLRNGTARCVGSPRGGSYLLPVTTALPELEESLSSVGELTAR